MSALLLAFFLWALLRSLERLRGGDERYPCRCCTDPNVRWNGRHFVHSTGLVEAFDEPLMTIDPLDDASPYVTHAAIPVGYADAVGWRP